MSALIKLVCEDLFSFLLHLLSPDWCESLLATSNLHLSDLEWINIFTKWAVVVAHSPRFGKTVVSNITGTRFKSSHWQNLYWTFVYCQPTNYIEKTKIKKKRPGKASLKFLFKENKWANPGLFSVYFHPSHITIQLQIEKA